MTPGGVGKCIGDALTLRMPFTKRLLQMALARWPLALLEGQVQGSLARTLRLGPAALLFTVPTEGIKPDASSGKTKKSSGEAERKSSRHSIKRSEGDRIRAGLNGGAAEAQAPLMAPDGTSSWSS